MDQPGKGARARLPSSLPAWAVPTSPSRPLLSITGAISHTGCRALGVQGWLRCVGHTGFSEEEFLAFLGFSKGSVPQRAKDPCPGAGPGMPVTGRPVEEWPAGRGDLGTAMRPGTSSCRAFDAQWGRGSLSWQHYTFPTEILQGTPIHTQSTSSEGGSL